ncbi:MAG: small multi-drug export protein [Raineya sp.]|jgi:hypothetical protein|nr:small multi-drug export protein [Raineya sp.]
MQKLISYLSVYLMASVKFALAPPTGYGLGLSPIEIIICTIAGMMTTATIVPILGQKLISYLRNRRLKKGKPVKVFTPRKRMIVKIWQKFSIWGIALLTPILFSPVVGCIIAVSFGVKRNKILLTMFVSAVFWALVMTFGVNLFGDIFLKK